MKILIVNKSPFGAHSDTYYLCKYAAVKHEVTYVGIAGSQNASNINMRLVSIPWKGRKLSKIIHFYKECLKECAYRYDVIFFNYFPGVFFLKILLKKNNIVFDIRTGFTSPNKYKRFMQNLFMRIESCFFEYISVISEGLRDKLYLPKQSFIIPLGGEPVETKPKTFDNLHLLYVGTFTNRNLEITIEGMSIFLEENPDCINLRYSLVGTGTEESIRRITEAIKKNGLENRIKLLGYIPNAELFPIFSECNVGVSFIPINGYFNVQPPTKTYEYLLAGMPVIATETQENKKIISYENGILITDDPSGFAAGIKGIWENKDMYDTERLTDSMRNHTWEFIVNQFYLPAFNLVIEKTNP